MKSSVRFSRFPRTAIIATVIVAIAMITCSTTAVVVSALNCNIATSCSDHATSVSEQLHENGTAFCKCLCRSQWGGVDCSVCPDSYNRSLDCSACATGRGRYPTCDVGCNNAQDCNGRAVADPADPNRPCTCVCANAWTGAHCEICPAGVNVAMNCGACLPGYSGYTEPVRCALKCTAANCSYHSTSVAGTSATVCSCTCRNSWRGDRCETCPAYWNPDPDCVTCLPGYAGPNCDLRVCDVRVDCNDHALSVSGEPGSCVCNCRNQWAGDKCQTCPSGVNALTDCDRCSGGFGPGVPVCEPACTNVVDCNGHAATVGGFRPNCTCNCANKWSPADRCATCPDPFGGADCGTCKDTFNGYPQCALACTNDANCSGHASAVTGNTITQCSCTCRNRWSSANCSVCAANFDSAQDCSKCAAGFDTYPQCYRTCTVAQDCSGHATGVTGNVNSACMCGCAGRWSGNRCQNCPVGMNTTADPSNSASLGCDSCIDGWGGFPQCTRTCNVPQDCNNRAATVSGNTPNCTCSCRNQWKGSDCGHCGTYYNRSDDCGSCAAGAQGYPDCYRDCDVTLDCNGNAQSVVGTTLTQCTCTCRNQWTGDKCQTCSGAFSAQADCGACNTANGYGGEYPNCFAVCTNNGDCSGRAVNVTGLRPNCTCNCSNQFTGSGCNICPSQYIQTGNCDRCASGYAGYPQCSPLCTIAANCNGHAVSVAGTLATGCSCTCQYKWNGTTCNTCPALYEQTQCRTCAAGRINYPTCAPACDANVACNGHGTVSGDQESGCLCNCRYYWGGSNCSTCPAHVSPASDCRTCEAGYARPPACYRVCTVAQDCSGNAISVSGDVGSGCVCTCRNRWRGLSCNICNGRFNRSNDCGTCLVAAMQPTYPRCYYRCTDVECPSGRARMQPQWFDGNRTRTACRCDCSTSTTATTAAATCAPPSICMPGWPEWNNCTQPEDSCFTDLDCSSHAYSVTGSVQDGCNCSCRSSWTGNDCSICPASYNAANDCSSCAFGFGGGGYPLCAFLCTNYDNCSGRAYSVSGHSGSGCTCRCSHQWTGDTCAICPPNYLQSTCSGCTSGYGGYPNCQPMCTIDGNCSSHAVAVSGTYATSCSCACRNTWTGSDCSSCPAGYDGTQDCGVCAAGYGGYPQCSPLCTNDVNCNNRATSVSGILRSGCTCNCRSSWYGQECQFCPARTNSSDDCTSCIAGHHGYPNCVRTCTLAGDCSSNAANVTGDGTVAGCSCQCRNQWRGPRCDQCSFQFNQSDDCGSCGAGFTPSPAFPVCLGACDITTVCSNHALSVSGDTSHGCVCVCRNGWSGSSCSICDSRFFTGADCDQCAAQFSGAPPNCHRQCDTVMDCSDHAIDAQGTLTVNTSCHCECMGQWINSDCSVCAPRYNPSLQCSVCAAGYVTRSYPDCWRICSTVTDCNNHAYAVTGDEGSGCRCSCTNQWTGPNCSSCPALYLQSTCDQCLPGFVEYPLCHRKCTLDDCGGSIRAVNVSGNNQTGCFCTCRNSWSGPTCAVCDPVYVQPSCGSCRPGLFNYPACNRDCSSNLDCNGHAAEVTGTTQAQTMGPECTCACANRWSGDRCDVCPGNIDPEKDCAECKDGYDQSTFPSCYRGCTLMGNCSNHASRVTGNELVGCNCTCINQWNGIPCHICPYGIDATLSNCGSCSSGFTGYPRCTRDCTFSDCSNRAYDVSGDTASGCDCKCRNYWNTSVPTTNVPGNIGYRAQCDVCPPQFNSASDCATCNVGFSGTPPDCTRPCSLSIDCFDRASTVSGNWWDCQCTCKYHWAPPRCEFCPWPYDARRDCNDCLPGYDNFPVCNPTCTVERNCSSHAVSVTRDASMSSCTCVCRNQWGGPDCSSCPAMFNASNDCLPNGATPAPAEPTTTTTTSSTTEASTAISSTSTTTTITPLPTTTEAPTAVETTTSSPPSTTIATTAPADTTTLSHPSTSSSTLAPPAPTTTAAGSTTTSTGTTTTSSSTTTTTTTPSSSSTTISSTSSTTTTSSSTSITTVPTTTTSATTTTAPSAPTTTTAGPCTLQSAKCAAGARGVTRTTSGACNCVCRNFWTGNGCGECASYFNQSSDCSTCTLGYAAANDDDTDPTKRTSGCVCVRHVSSTITLPGPNPKSVVAIRQATAADLVVLLNNAQPRCTSGDVRMSPVVYHVTKLRTTPDGKALAGGVAMYSVQFDAVLRGSIDCDPVEASGKCFEQKLSKENVDCNSFPNLVSAMGGDISNCSKALIFIAPVTMGMASPCGGGGAADACLAAPSIDDSKFTPDAASTTTAPPSDGSDGAPIGMIIGIIVGIIVLIALAILTKKYVSYRKKRATKVSTDDDPDRHHMQFHMGAVSSEILIPDADHYVDDSGATQITRTRVNTQFLMNDMVTQATRAPPKSKTTGSNNKQKPNVELDDDDQGAATAADVDEFQLSSPAQTQPQPQQQQRAGKAQRASALDDLLSPKEGESMLANGKAPTAEGANGAQATSTQTKGRKRAISMSFI